MIETSPLCLHCKNHYHLFNHIIHAHIEVTEVPSYANDIRVITKCPYCSQTNTMNVSFTNLIRTVVDRE